MSEERRERQDLNLFPSTLDTLSGVNKGQSAKRAHCARFPNRWERIGSRARDPESVFKNLIPHINEESLREAFKALDGTKALGLDGISKAAYGENLEENLADLVHRIKNGSYKPQSKKEVLIPKANGKMRPIAIGCFEDKLVEWCVAKVLECIYEPCFIRNSFGYRPGKSAHDAMRAIYYTLKDNKRPFVVEMDFASFFNRIPHRELMKVLKKKITDDKFKGLIGRFLRVGILDQSGKTTTTKCGTPQGSVASPILANIYLNEVLDQWFIEKHASYNQVMVRYADDGLFFFRKQESAESFMAALSKRVKRYKLALNEEKTGIVDFSWSGNNDFTFLGFTVYWGRRRRPKKRPLKLKTNKEKLHKTLQEFEAWVKKERSSTRTSILWEKAKAKLQGHYNYFGYWMNRSKLKHFYDGAVRILFKWLNRRSQKKSYDWESFNRRLEGCPLPIPPEPSKLRQLGWNPYV